MDRRHGQVGAAPALLPIVLGALLGLALGSCAGGAGGSGGNGISQGGTSSGGPWHETFDSTIPAPTGLKAEVLVNNYLQLTWNARSWAHPQGAFYSWALYQSSTSADGPFAFIGTAIAESQDVTTDYASLTYWFRASLIVVDTNGHSWEGLKSAAVSVVPSLY
jgi:hypothetical protein